MSTLELPHPDEAVFTEDEDEDEEYRERQNYEYENRDEEEYQDGDRQEHDSREEEEEEDYGVRVRSEEQDVRREDYERHDHERHDHEIGDLREVNGGYQTPPEVKEERAELEVYKSICDNLRDTLARIKSYSKVNLMGDAKASYFTIVDAVLSGPHEIPRSRLTSVLGVSENTVSRVRRLGERLAQQTDATRVEHKMSRRLRHRNSESNLGRAGTLR